MRLLTLFDSERVPPPLNVMVLPLVPASIRSVTFPAEPSVNVLPVAMASEPAPLPPATVKLWLLSRVREFEVATVPRVRLSIVGLIPLIWTAVLPVVLVMTTLAPLAGTPFGVQFPATFH